jgi:prefoldin subunit 5
MSTTTSLTNIETNLQVLTSRVNSLEAEIAQLKQKSDEDSDWIARIDGSFKDDPGWDEIIELGRQIRKADFS